MIEMISIDISDYCMSIKVCVYNVRLLSAGYLHGKKRSYVKAAVSLLAFNIHREWCMNMFRWT